MIVTIRLKFNKIESVETAYFLTLDMTYVYSQLILDPEISRHCIFRIVSGECTGTYCFINGFYGLTDMPEAFQKVMDYNLVALNNTHCFLDDIIIVSRGAKEDNVNSVYKCLTNVCYLHKYQFAKTQIEGLRNKFFQSGISPPESQTSANLSLSTLKVKATTLIFRFCSLYGQIQTQIFTVMSTTSTPSETKH